MPKRFVCVGAAGDAARGKHRAEGRPRKFHATSVDVARAKLRAYLGLPEDAALPIEPYRHPGTGCAYMVLDGDVVITGQPGTEPGECMLLCSTCYQGPLTSHYYKNKAQAPRAARCAAAPRVDNPPPPPARPGGPPPVAPRGGAALVRLSSFARAQVGHQPCTWR